MKYAVILFLLCIPLLIQAQKIYKVKYDSQADLKIFMVEYKSQAGWRNSEKQHLLF